MDLDSLVSNVALETRAYVERQGEIALWLSDAIKRKGFSLKVFAKLTRMQGYYLTRILSGEINLTLKTIARIETVLGEKINGSN